MENEMWVAPSHWHRVVGRDNRSLGDTTVALMRQRLFDQKISWKDAHAKTPTPAVKTQADYLRRGMNAMEIVGGDYNLSLLKELRMFGGSEEYLLQAVARGKLPKPMVVAAMMAKSIGEVMAKADFNFTHTVFDYSSSISTHPALDPMMRRLLARCKAMDVPVPFVQGLGANQFLEASRENQVMRDLTSEDSEWIRHFKWKDQRAILGGLSAIEHVQGAAAGAARETPREPGGGVSGSMNVRISEETPREPGRKRWYFRFPLAWWWQETRGREWWGQAIVFLLALMVTPFWIVGLLLRIVVGLLLWIIGFLFTKEGRSCLESLAVFGAIIWAIIYLYQHC
jgi:hypothetical protein